MKHRDLEKMLFDNGFSFVRRNKHPIYSDGLTSIALPTGSKLRHGMFHKVKAEIRRAVEKREQAQQPTTTPKEQTQMQFNPMPKIRIPETKIHSMEIQEDNVQSMTRGIKLSTSKKYSPDDRQRMRGRISVLRGIGHTGSQIFQIMKMEGFKAPDGSEFKLFHVTNAVAAMKEQKPKNISPVRATPPPVQRVEIQKKLPGFVLDILTSPELTDAKKVKLLMAYAED